MSPPLQIFTERNQYRTCHVQIPGEEGRQAAIQIEDRLYVLLKVVPDRAKAEKTAELLIQRGRQVAITQTPKSFAIWSYESGAKLESGRKTREPLILESPDRYSPCRVQVPDAVEPVQAIQVGGAFYGLFRTAESRQQGLEIAKKLHQAGDEVAVTLSPQGVQLWMREPLAQPLP